MASQGDEGQAGFCPPLSSSEPTAGQPSNESAAEDDNTGSTASKFKGRKDQCQVEGCNTDLTQEGKAYCVKRRLCNEHMRADAVRCRGQEGLFRFCFQCGKLEPLSFFEGMKRSCRTRLQQRKQRETRRCNSDVTYRFGRSQGVLRQQHQTQQTKQTVQVMQNSDSMANMLHDIQEELLPLQLHDIDYYEDAADSPASGQKQRHVSANGTVPHGKAITFSSSLAPVAEHSASYQSVPLPAVSALYSDNSLAVAAAGLNLVPGATALARQHSFSTNISTSSWGNSLPYNNTSNSAPVNAMFGMSNSTPVNAAADSGCRSCRGSMTQQQLLMQQQQQASLQIRPSVAGLSAPLAVSTAAHNAGAVVSGPLPLLAGFSAPALADPQLNSLRSSGLTGSRHQAVPGSMSTPLPSLSGSYALPGCSYTPVTSFSHKIGNGSNFGGAAAAAGGANSSSGFHADLMHECLLQMSAESNLNDEETLPYSDADIRNLLEGALQSAAMTAQQPSQQQQQPAQTFIPMFNGQVSAAAAATAGLTMHGRHALHPAGSSSVTGKPPIAPLATLPHQQQVHTPLQQGMAAPNTAPLPVVQGRKLSKAAMLEQLQRIHQQQLALLQQIHLHDSEDKMPTSGEGDVSNAALALTEELLQSKLQMVQQQYAQMLEEVKQIKHSNGMCM